MFLTPHFPILSNYYIIKQLLVTRKLKFMKKTIFLFVFLFLANLAVFADGNFDKVMDSWKGENISNLIDVWGYPSREKFIANKKLYIWSSDTRQRYSSNGYGTTTGITYYCDKIVEVDENENIVRGQLKGNNCPMITSKELANPDHNYWKEKKEQKVQAKLEKKQLKEQTEE